ncbi:MAG TPA: trypsin-like serine protease, partial [Methylomirabilota bacterium]|nr:trypsin-like serine protease [Methylomirabilota bacterium]
MICRQAAFAIAMLAAGPAQAVITPAPDRAFGTNVAGQDVLALMGREPGNPAVNQVVVRLRNLAPVDVDGNGSADFLTWSGTLLASNWVLTCAHALEGTNGTGGGVLPANLRVETDDGQVLLVDSFTNHPGWTKEQYLLGNDLALVRLTTGVVGVSNYARLNSSPLRAPVGVVIAGFGEQGDGYTGGNGNPDFLATGLNTLDATAGVTTTAGNGTPTNVFPTTPASVGLMDFDRWTNGAFACLNPSYAFRRPAAESEFSFMGENETANPVRPCTNSMQGVSGYFDAAVCDFFPAEGDSGGPAFLWPGYPRLPDTGYCLSASPVVAGVLSFVNTGAGTNNNGVYGNVAGFTLVQPHLGWIYQAARPLAERDSDGDGQNDEAEYLAGTDPYSVPPNPADYHAAPGYGTFMNSSDTRAYELVLDDVVLTGQTNEPGDQVVLAFRVSVRNTGGGYHGQVMIFPNAPAPPDWPVEVVTPFLELPDLAPAGSTSSSVATAPEPLLLRCAATNVALVTNTVLAGQRLQISSVELYQMCPPVAAVDAATDAAFVAYTESGGGTNHFATIEFATNTTLLASLTPGTLLLENPSAAGHTLRRPGATEPPTMHLLSQLIHAEENYNLFHEDGQQHRTEMLLVESVVVTNGSVLVSGWVRQLYEVLCAGTIQRTQLDAFDDPVRDPYNPPHGNSMFTGSEWDKRGDAISAALDKGPRAGELADLLGFFTLHFPFNDVKLGPGITLDGEYLLRGLNIGLDVRIREAAIQKVVWTLSTRSDLDLVLTAEGGASNGGLSLLEKERQLAYAPLPPITLSVFGFPLEIQPAFVVKAGCEVSAGTRVVVPIQHSVEAGCTM